MSKPGVVEIHGRQYETVALRIQKFREAHPLFTLKTEVKVLDQEQVMIEAQILSDDGRLIANGHAQEFRQSSAINKTSYVENCETSAIGRALATFGLGGTEFATADELVNAIKNKPQPSEASPLVAMKQDAFQSFPPEEQEFLRKVAADVSALLDEKRDAEAQAFLENQKLDMEEKLGIWFLFDSKQRAALKEAAKQAEMIRRASGKAAAA